MRTRAAHPTFVLALSLLAQACLAVDVARAQHGFVPPPDRPLHERLAAATSVAFATVVRVDTGRIAFEAATPVVGTVPEDFEIKRAPSTAPPWLVGNRAMLLLAGARSPYLWVEKPIEHVVLEGDTAEARWHEALLAMERVRTKPAARRDLYARWSDGDAEDLAATGLRGLTDIPGMGGVLTEDFALGRAHVAMDAARPLPVRRRATRAAIRHLAGVRAMLSYVADESPAVDPEIAELALKAGLIAKVPEFEASVVDVLDDPETELGAVGLRLAIFARGPEVERRLSELAVGHPDEEVRSGAAHALKRLRRNRDG